MCEYLPTKNSECLVGGSMYGSSISGSSPRILIDIESTRRTFYFSKFFKNVFGAEFFFEVFQERFLERARKEATKKRKNS